ncbi:MAG: CAP domain-containing protein, partial [Rhizobacter sp.]
MIKFDLLPRVAVLSLVATLAACGGGGDDSAPASTPTTPTAGDTPTDTGSTGDTGNTGNTGNTGDTVTATPYTGNCDVANFQADALAQVNAFRAQARTCGGTTYPAVPALVWNDKLTQAAYGHSTDMATKNYFSHTSQDGRSVGQRITATGYVWSSYGENIAAGQRTMASVMTGWQNSAGHCANLMSSGVTQIGL